MKKSTLAVAPQSFVDSAEEAQVALQARLSHLTTKVKEETVAPTELGKLKSIPIKEVQVGDSRFRRNLGDLDDLARSIREVGLVQPIVVDDDLRLISGLRRLRAFELLGRTDIPARLVNLEDPLFACIEEDRARKELLPSEKFEITEAIRERAKDEAWRRKVLGGRLDDATQRGRADDFLAKHVGISRPTLAKIRAIVEAATQDAEKFSAVKEALDKDGKVDRHYRELRQLMQDDVSMTFEVLVINESWQVYAEPSSLVPLQVALKEAWIASFASAETILYLPARVDMLPRAAQALKQAGFRWLASAGGADQHIWLIGARASLKDATVGAAVGMAEGKSSKEINGASCLSVDLGTLLMPAAA